MRIQTYKDGDDFVVKIRGDLSEDLQEGLRELAQDLSGGAVLFDLSKVDLVTSTGALAWKDFAAGLRRRKISVRYRSAPQSFLECAQAYPGFAAKKEILSASKEFRCDRCSIGQKSDLDISQIRDDVPTLNLSCSECQGESKFVGDWKTFCDLVKSLT